jgi:hypothetical protein
MELAQMAMSRECGYEIVASLQIGNILTVCPISASQEGRCNGVMHYINN